MQTDIEEPFCVNECCHLVWDCHHCLYQCVSHTKEVQSATIYIWCADLCIDYSNFNSSPWYCPINQIKCWWLKAQSKPVLTVTSIYRGHPLKMATSGENHHISYSNYLYAMVTCWPAVSIFHMEGQHRPGHSGHMLESESFVMFLQHTTQLVTL